jgi:hypothetical protein
LRGVSARSVLRSRVEAARALEIVAIGETGVATEVIEAEAGTVATGAVMTGDAGTYASACSARSVCTFTTLQRGEDPPGSAPVLRARRTPA